MSNIYEELLERVKKGERLSHAELNAVRTALESEGTKEDPYTLLHIIGKAGDDDSAPLVRRFVTIGVDNPDSDEDMLRRLAIQILGQWWKREDVFESVAKAAFEDPSLMVRSMAASTLGDLGLAHATLRKKAAVLLLKGLEEWGRQSPEVWGAFYNGALTLADVEYSKRPIRPSELKPDQLDQSVLSKVRACASASSS
jgi:hypothetical protein